MKLGPVVERWLLRSSDVWALRVCETSRISPHMLRISFAGQNLQRFAVDDNLHVRLVLPPDTENRGTWAAVDDMGLLHAGDVRPHYRKYTIRNVDAAAGRMDIDFVLHDAAGPGTAWAEAARRGDLVGIIGPGGRSIDLADWYLIAGDDSALPAIARIAENLSAAAKGTIIIEVDNAADEQPLAKPLAMSIEWLHRLGHAPGSTTLLMDAIAAVEWPAGSSSAFGWVAAEAATAQKVRRYFKSTRRLGKEQQLVVAYWTRS